MHKLLPKAFWPRRLARSLSLVVCVVATTSLGRADDLESIFRDSIQPQLETLCHRCHNAEVTKSGIRVDRLSGAFEESQLALWGGVREQIAAETMPPAEEPQPSASERAMLVAAIDRGIAAAKSRPTPRNGGARKLTVSQYRNTLRELLGLREDFTDTLPPDGRSRDGFANDAATMVLSPLQVEAYFEIAQQALDAAIVDESRPPEIQNFRVDFGERINPSPPQEPLILGAFSMLLDSADFSVAELQPDKPFAYKPHEMQKAFRFIEGYQGNDTVRGWREFNGLDHNVFACFRGTSGYPKGDPYSIVGKGMLLRPAIPSSEIFGEQSTYGPMANFKISLRELPDFGEFRVTVKAARYDDALLLDAGATRAASDASLVAQLEAGMPTTIAVEHPGVYQIDVQTTAGSGQHLNLSLGDRRFSGRLFEAGEAAGERYTPFAIVRLAAGALELSATYAEPRLKALALSPVAAESELGRRFAAFERRTPWLGVHLGLRRDCGSTLAPVGDAQNISAGEAASYVFEGAIRDFPSPEVEPNNVNYLAGIREIGVRSEYTDGRDMPRLLISSIEFEGPLYEIWPPPSHRAIFIESASREDPPAYAREVIAAFATRAFRRPATDDEIESVLGVWRTSFNASGDFQASVKDALLVALTSPQFLLLIEESAGPEAEELSDYELASKLSYFLWNGPPDRRLLELAAAGRLHSDLQGEFERMLADERARRFIEEFTSQWLALDKLDVLAVDATRYPKLTRDLKRQLRQEPITLVAHLLERNLPIANLVRSEFLLANDATAAYYGLADRCEHGLRFAPIEKRHDDVDRHLGGLLSQAGVLAGLSDGREGNPVKRGAWLARKIIAEPPADPPPNVPQLPKEGAAQALSFREKLAAHRQQEGCAKCHAGIDPWGLPLEQFDAGGLFSLKTADANSDLPDGTHVAGLEDLKAYLSEERIDSVAFSFLMHLATYALGRPPSYNELVFLREEGLRLNADGYRARDLLWFVVSSEMFLKK